MNIERYQIVKAINTKEGLIPIWDSRITFQEDDVVGQSISVKGDTLFKEYFSLLDCIYDLKTRELNVGIEINVYPDENKLAFKKGESVFYEQSHKVISEAKISDIVYEEYDLKILRGKNMDDYYSARFKIIIERDTLYAIKNWKPFYVLDNGKKIIWEHQLYHKNFI